MPAVMMICAAVSIANAHQTGAGESILAGPCVHLHDQDQCVSYPTGECFWDEADQRCENRYNNEDRCSLIDDLDACIYSQFECFWDHDDQRCERRD